MHYEAQRRDLCEKIARWRNWSAFNEEATIQSIVLPILELAGYDTRNPEEVLPQARDIQGNKPDLMLYKTSPLSNGVEWCVIEAKALGKPLNNYVAQVGQYLIASNAQWYVLTDGFEWRFFDKNHPQNNFYRAAITLEMPGALDALCCLLDKARPTPDFDCAFQTLIEARLREAARQRAWDEQCELWRKEEILAKPLREALQDVQSKFSPHKDFIKRWEQKYEQALGSGQPPDWWEYDESVSHQSVVTAPVGSPAQKSIDDGAGVCLPELRRCDLTFTVPRVLKVNGQTVPLSANSWAQVLMAVLKLLDERNCLPQAPFPSNASGTKLLYDEVEHASWHKHSRDRFVSKQYGKTIYVNKHGNAERIIRRTYDLLKTAQCPSITPETVCVVYEHKQK